MADTKIEWAEKTWNPIAGCSVISPGCKKCYAMRLAARLERMGQAKYAGLTQPSKAGPVWTGRITVDDKALLQPLSWRKPARVFVNSMSDLFHPAVADDVIDRVFAVMALCPHLTFLVLTKRADRMRRYCSGLRDRSVEIAQRAVWLGIWADPDAAARDTVSVVDAGPLPNVWLGVSVERQEEADERIPDLLATPAAVRFISAEPLLGPIDLDVSWHGESAIAAECWGDCAWCDHGYPALHNCRRKTSMYDTRSGLDWVIVGGESGPSARPMHPEWARSLRDQCAAAEVPFFFKQWGGWTPGENVTRTNGTVDTAVWFDDRWSFNRENLAYEGVHCDDEPDLYRVGKKAAGRLLDGVEHNGMPSHD